MPPQTVLLTGGTGYIGSHAAVALLEAGYGVVLLDNLCNSSASVAQRISAITSKPAPLVVGDVRDTGLVRQTLVDHGCDAVMHFAGLKAVGESERVPLDYYGNNVQGSWSLLVAMEQANVRRIVFSSSATVYGTPVYLPFDEEHPTAAINTYGRTKRQVEEMLEDVCRSDATWSAACLRYFNPAGAHSSAQLGEDPSGIPNNLMPYIAKVASGELATLRVFGGDYNTRDGTGERDYIHVVDLAEGHLAALKYLDGNPGLHVFNLGTGSACSVLEMIRMFERASGRPVPYEVAPRRAGDLPAYWADPARARQLLDWQARRSPMDMCSSGWAWQQSCKAG